jgi:hypothetical protein
VLESFHTCPIPEIARLGRTRRAWKDQFLGYFTTNRASNGGTEAVNGIIARTVSSNPHQPNRMIIRRSQRDVEGGR